MPNNFGENLKRLRKERGWSMGLLARKMRLSNKDLKTVSAAISFWESGKRKRVYIDCVTTAAEVFGVTLDEMVYGENP